jgi:YD repeat-containing protein
MYAQTLDHADANNRIASGFTYDAAGNITNDSIHTYTYDAENRIVKVDTGTTAVYSYDAEGRRVSKTAGSTSYEYLFDLGGRAVTELLAGTATTNRTEAYARWPPPDNPECWVGYKLFHSQRLARHRTSPHEPERHSDRNLHGARRRRCKSQEHTI